MHLSPTSKLGYLSFKMLNEYSVVIFPLHSKFHWFGEKNELCYEYSVISFTLIKVMPPRYKVTVSLSV